MQLCFKSQPTLSREASYYLESGHWFLSLYNDGASEQTVRTMILKMMKWWVIPILILKMMQWRVIPILYQFLGGIHCNTLGRLDLSLSQGLLRYIYCLVMIAVMVVDMIAVVVAILSK